MTTLHALFASIIGLWVSLIGGVYTPPHTVVATPIAVVSSTTIANVMATSTTNTDVYHFIPLATTSPSSINQFLLEQQVGASHFASEDSISSGFLVPTSASVPAGFKMNQYQYLSNKRVATGFYDISFENGTSFIKFTETIYNSNPYYYGDKDAGYKNDLSIDMKYYPEKIMDFTYNGNPGMILSAHSRLYSTDNGYYKLVWNDNGSNLVITTSGLPKKEFPPSVLIDMLKTMVRYGTSTTPWSPTLN